MFWPVLTWYLSTTAKNDTVCNEHRVGCISMDVNASYHCERAGVCWIRKVGQRKFRSAFSCLRQWGVTSGCDSFLIASTENSICHRCCVSLLPCRDWDSVRDEIKQYSVRKSKDRLRDMIFNSVIEVYYSNFYKWWKYEIVNLYPIKIRHI